MKHNSKDKVSVGVHKVGEGTSAIVIRIGARVAKGIGMTHKDLVTVRLFPNELSVLCYGAQGHTPYTRVDETWKALVSDSGRKVAVYKVSPKSFLIKITIPEGAMDRFAITEASFKALWRGIRLTLPPASKRVPPQEMDRTRGDVADADPTESRLPRPVPVKADRPKVPHYVVRVGGGTGFIPAPCIDEAGAIALAEQLATKFPGNQYCVLRPTMLKRSQAIETIAL